MDESFENRTFQGTWDAAVLLEDAITCAQCGQTTEELQHLGTVCKHGFCWSCIKQIGKVAFAQCDLCASPLEPAKPTPARTLNGMFKGIQQFKDLLNLYENAAIAEGITAVAKSKAQKRAATPPRRTVAEFLATQQHVNDDYEDDKASSRPPSRLRSTTPTAQKRGRVTPSPSKNRPPSRQGSSTKKPARSDRSRTVSGCSSISIELDDFADEKSPEKNLFKKEPKEEYLSPVLPKWDVKPLATSTQIPTLFMTQQFTQYQQPPTPVTPAIVPHVPTGRSFEFTKKPATVFGAKDTKHDKLFNSAGPSKKPVKEERKSGDFTPLLPKKEDFCTPTRTPAQSHFDPNMLTLERGAPRRSLTHRHGDREVIAAVMSADLDSVRKLIAADADLNEFDPELGTPLFIAASSGNLAMCELLVEHGAIINAHCGQECNTALHSAVKNHHEEVAHYLMSKGASRQVRNIRNMTPAQMADDSSPLRKLVEKYKKYPKQMPIPPRFPSHIVVCIDEFSQKALSRGMMEKAQKYFEVESDLTSDTTHFAAVIDSEGIANGSNQKLITAMLRGLKVVTLNYIEDSIKIGEVIRDWCPYEVSRIRFREHPVAEGSVVRCRRAKERLEPGLFKGCKFFIFSKHFPTYGKRPFLSNVILLAEGEVLNKEPPIDENDPLPFHKQELASPYFILYEQGTKIPTKILDDARYHKVSPGWLFECITRYEFLTPY